MNDIMNQVGIGGPSLCETKDCYADTLISNLQRQKLRAQSQLDSVTAALDALEKNPEIAKVLELISKAGR